MFNRNRTHDVDTTTETHVLRPWRIVAYVIAIGSLALGIWALARTGLHTDHMFHPVRHVLGLPYTPALAVGEIVFGAVMLLAAWSRTFGRLVMVVGGGVVLLCGVLVVSDTSKHRIHRWTAADHMSGWLFVIVGAIVVLGATMLPTVASRDRTIRPDQVDNDDDRLFWHREREARS